MVTRVVHVEAQSESYMAEVEVDVEALNSERMPDQLTGRFTKLPSRTQEVTVRANLLLHSNRSSDGLSHTIWFHGNRTGYRFTMTSETVFDFSAQKM
jgi:hypothetical protein